MSLHAEVRKGNHNDRKEELEKIAKAMAPLGIELEAPQPGDWLDEHEETGQTFRQYVESLPNTATSQRNKIYIVPLGDFSASQKELVRCVSEFLTAFYGLAVVVQHTVELESVNPKKQRVHPKWGDRQILSTFILDKLADSLPPDAATYICFTTSDLWPGKGWNFVFGQASLAYRVGVWSLYRFGSNFKQCLKRTLATAVHESAHMFSMKHCTAYSCGMCGSNSLPESDSRPLHFCPECTPKVAWATGIDLVDRAHKLGALCEQWGFKEEAQYYAESAALLSSIRKG